MKLLEEIIDGAVNSDVPVTSLLRRCLVLAAKMKNAPLRSWVERELNGYGADDELPDYRLGVGTALGTFSGPLGAQIRNQPLPSSILDEEHRHFATAIRLQEPVATYEGAKRSETYQLRWPADLIALYQSRFIRGYALKSAWIPVPGGMMVGLVDAVRTRVLSFAIEITAELPSEAEGAVAQIPPSTVDRLVYQDVRGQSSSRHSSRTQCSNCHRWK